MRRAVGAVVVTSVLGATWLGAAGGMPSAMPADAPMPTAATSTVVDGTAPTRPGPGQPAPEDTCRADEPLPDVGPAAQAVAAARLAMAEHDLKAVILRVTSGGEEVVTVALGETMTDVPATADMHFRNGAVAISYLGTVLLQLVDEGVVGLDDTIDAWLPDLPAADQVTLRMLADSTSGYPDYVPVESFLEDLEADPFRTWEPEELLAVALEAPLWYEPGTNWSYAHTNFVVLGQALTAITGRPVAELIRERVLDPLGMDDTESHQTAYIPEPVLHAFTTERGTYEESTFWNPSWTLAEGAIMVTDICDLATSARAIGTGSLVSDASHEQQVGPSLVGLGGPTDTCPAGVCRQQLPTAYYGIGTVVLNGWVLQNPAFNGFGAVQAYLPGHDLAIATSATLGESVPEGTNGGYLVFQAVAAALVPDQLPRP